MLAQPLNMTLAWHSVLGAGWLLQVIGMLFVLTCQRGCIAPWCLGVLASARPPF